MVVRAATRYSRTQLGSAARSRREHGPEVEAILRATCSKILPSGAHFEKDTGLARGSEIAAAVLALQVFARRKRRVDAASVRVRAVVREAAAREGADGRYAVAVGLAEDIGRHRNAANVAQKALDGVVLVDGL